MTDQDKAAYLKLTAELRAIAARLHEISEGGYADMEGADADEFRVSAILWSELRLARRTVVETVVSVEKIVG
jgi:hypothetical protein